jgi:ABC-type sugar transport system ATPase subunit
MERPIDENIGLVVLDRLRGRLGLVSDGAVRAEARSFIGRLRIRARSERAPVSQLSGGNQQKVVLAKWLAARPSLLLLNDPTRGIDVGAKAEVHGVIRELAEAGISVLVWSSEAEELLLVCDRIAVLRKGEVSAVLDPATTTRAELLLAVVGDDEDRGAGAGRSPDGTAEGASTSDGGAAGASVPAEDEGPAGWPADG